MPKKADSFEFEQLDLDALYLYGEIGKPKNHDNKGESTVSKKRNSFEIEQLALDALYLHGETGKPENNDDHGGSTVSKKFDPDDIQQLDLDTLYLHGGTGKPEHAADKSEPQHGRRLSQSERDVFDNALDEAVIEEGSFPIFFENVDGQSFVGKRDANLAPSPPHTMPRRRPNFLSPTLHLCDRRKLTLAPLGRYCGTRIVSLGSSTNHRERRRQDAEELEACPWTSHSHR